MSRSSESLVKYCYTTCPRVNCLAAWLLQLCAYMLIRNDNRTISTGTERCCAFYLSNNCDLARTCHESRHVLCNSVRYRIIYKLCVPSFLATLPIKSYYLIAQCLFVQRRLHSSNIYESRLAASQDQIEWMTSLIRSNACFGFDTRKSARWSDSNVAS